MEIELSTCELTVSLSTGVLVQIAKGWRPKLLSWVLHLTTPSTKVSAQRILDSVQYFEQFPVINNWYIHTYLHSLLFQSHSGRLCWHNQIKEALSPFAGLINKCINSLCQVCPIQRGCLLPASKNALNTFAPPRSTHKSAPKLTALLAQSSQQGLCFLETHVSPFPSLLWLWLLQPEAAPNKPSSFLFLLQLWRRGTD